ncbi:hypothetical protein [Nocardiopsis chromatogenes]|uniref:hypothetical protein n=1 Tax=Nocardiopsis chromatogenes TaxID=280239 RepID=UPI0012684AFB|nr:hypothetical protein [Nocardiopsis chromatogenes]
MTRFDAGELGRRLYKRLVADLRDTAEDHLGENQNRVYYRFVRDFDRHGVEPDKGLLRSWAREVQAGVVPDFDGQ